MLKDEDVEFAKRSRLRSIISDLVHDTVGSSTLVYVRFRGGAGPVSLHAELLKQARFLARKEPKKPTQASVRRSVSASYDALLHLLVDEATFRDWNDVRGSQHADTFLTGLLSYRHMQG